MNKPKDSQEPDTFGYPRCSSCMQTTVNPSDGNINRTPPSSFTLAVPDVGLIAWGLPHVLCALGSTPVSTVVLRSAVGAAVSNRNVHIDFV